MQNVIRIGLLVFIAVFAATAVLTLAGIAYLWFLSPSTSDLPYLRWLIGLTIGEAVAVVVALVKQSLRFLPRVHLTKKEDETIEFMKDFISPATTITIVTNRASWLSRNDGLHSMLAEKARQNIRVEVVTAEPISPSIKKPLTEAGVRFYEVTDGVPEARFTLLNADRAGAERLAIARGVHPDHEITVFDSSSGPQIIALAKDIARHTKAMSNV